MIAILHPSPPPPSPGPTQIGDFNMLLNPKSCPRKHVFWTLSHVTPGVHPLLAFTRFASLFWLFHAGFWPKKPLWGYLLLLSLLAFHAGLHPLLLSFALHPSFGFLTQAFDQKNALGVSSPLLSLLAFHAGVHPLLAFIRFASLFWVFHAGFWPKKRFGGIFSCFLFWQSATASSTAIWEK